MKEKAEEVSKTKSEVSSLNIKLKWAQNKLKSETEAHKEAQAKLAVTQQKLQESKEEGEQIRNDMKAMIVAYQVSFKQFEIHLHTFWCLQSMHEVYKWSHFERQFTISGHTAVC